MRIAFVSLMGGLQWGGSEALWHAIASEALQNKDEVLVSVYEWETVHEKIRSLQQQGAKVIFRKQFNPAAGLIEKVMRSVKNKSSLLNGQYSGIADFNPDHVFISQGGNFDLAVHHRGLYELLIKKNIPYSFICHSHDQYSFIPEKNIYPDAADLFIKAKNVFFVSQRQLELTERRLITKLTNATITYNPLNISLPPKIQPWPAEETAGFAMVGALTGSKGHDTILDILRRETWKGRNWHLNIYGTGGGLKYLEDLVVFYGLISKVTFHGMANTIEDIWKQNHLLLIPSAAEGLPTSLLEAMVCGRSAVVTDVGGNAEMIIENQTGFLSCAPSVNSYGDAMERAWNQKALWRQYGENAYQSGTGSINFEPQKKIYQLLLNAKD